MPQVSKEALQEYVSFLDDYNDRMAIDRPGQLKWGTEWLPSEVVRSYRANRGKDPDEIATPEQLKQELEAAQTKVYAMQQAVTQAKQSGAFLWPALLAQRTGLAQADNARHIQRARTHAMLVPTPINKRMQPNAFGACLAYIQRPNTFWAIDFMAGE